MIQMLLSLAKAQRTQSFCLNEAHSGKPHPAAREGRREGMTVNDKTTVDLAKFLYEVGLLKRIRRTGWWVAGIDQPESVAEHVFRTSVLGYLLAGLEGADPIKTAVLCLFHDLQETRLGDLHRLNAQYLDTDEAETKAFHDMTERLPDPIRWRMVEAFQEWRKEYTLEARLARDADRLECLIQAREYQAQGCSSVSDWINNSYRQLESAAAQQLAEACMQVDPKDWWHEGIQKE
jgi:putative hydrolase of HD superfamily